MIVLSRVDSRLIHGQVIEAWLPYLKATRLVVADDLAAADPLSQSAMMLAVPPDVEVLLGRVDALDFRALASDGVATLLLFRDIPGVLQARARGLPDGPLNLGNVHSGPGRTALSRSVFVSEDERTTLSALNSSGMAVVIQAVPHEKPTALAR